jgi:ribulose-phosphate 3-epimerase
MKLQIAPSILSADFGKLNAEIASVEPYSELLHVDVMDGHFVPNITIGPPVVRCIKTKLPLDCHLMIQTPEQYIEDFVKAGASSITVHQEVCPHLSRVIQQIKSYKNSKTRLPLKAAVSLNPATPIEMIEEVLDEVDMVLIMSVNPGFGGQEFIDSVLGKIMALRELKPELDIQVDGGINPATAQKCVQAGANILVAGSYIFEAKNRRKAIENLRNSFRKP